MLFHRIAHSFFYLPIVTWCISALGADLPPYVKVPPCIDLKISHRRNGDGGVLYILDSRDLGQVFIYSWQDAQQWWPPKLDNRSLFHFRGSDFGPYKRTYTFDVVSKRISGITFHSYDKYPRIIQIMIVKRRSNQIFDFAYRIVPDIDFLSHFPVIDFDNYDAPSSP